MTGSSKHPVHRFGPSNGMASSPMRWLVATFLIVLTSVVAQAQPFSLEGHIVSGGGGISASGPYSMTGAIEPLDTSEPMSGGTYHLASGFWSYAVGIQTPGTPTLSIHLVNNAVVIQWPASDVSYILESAPTLTPSNEWTPVAATPVCTGGVNQVTNAMVQGSTFYRLKKQ
jgi:hypothetical protein